MGRKKKAQTVVDPAEVQLLNGADLAPLMRVSKTSAYEFVKSGKLPTVKLPDGRLRVRMVDFRKWQEENLTPAAE